MNFPEKIGQLRQIISDTLTPLITRDYLLLDVPYHGNIGDTLIWQGETDFLNTLPYKCKGVYSAHSWRRQLRRPLGWRTGFQDINNTGIS